MTTNGLAPIANEPRSVSTAGPRRFWNRRNGGDGKRPWERPPGEALAALRLGIGREPGAVPTMWPYYTQLGVDGPLPSLRAEHLALTLYAVHQQSQDRSMHRSGVGLGAAVRFLRQHGKFSEEAIDRRFAAAATATSVNELAVHLRGLVTQLRAINQPLDYDRLESDLRGWDRPESAARTRRQWGRDYFLRSRDDSDSVTTDEPPTDTSQPASS